MEEGQEIGHNTFYTIRNEHLLLEQLNFVALRLHVRFDFREVEYTGQVERIIYVEVNIEQRLVEAHWVELAVEFFVIFRGQFARGTYPCRVGVVDDVRYLFCFPFGLFAFFGSIVALVLFAELDRNRHKLRILA